MALRSTDVDPLDVDHLLNASRNFMGKMLPKGASALGGVVLYKCQMCDGTWHDSEPEAHEPGCVFDQLRQALWPFAHVV